MNVGDIPKATATIDSQGRRIYEKAEITDEFPVVQNATQNIGWMHVSSTQYTSSSPLVVADTQVALPIRLDTVLNSHVPFNDQELWDGSSIQCSEEGALVAIRLNFTMISDNNEDWFNVIFRINGSINASSQTLVSPKLAGETEFASVNTQLFVGSTFVASGCDIFIDTQSYGSDVSLYDFDILIGKVFSPSGRTQP